MNKLIIIVVVIIILIIIVTIGPMSQDQLLV